MIILLLIFAHLLSDFWLQSNHMVRHKLKTLNTHVLHHFLTTSVALLIIWGGVFTFQNAMAYFILPLSTILVSHWIIDRLKIKWTENKETEITSNQKQLVIFLADQLVHLLVILSVSAIFFNINLLETVSVFDLSENNGLNVVNSILFIGIIFIMSTTFSSIIIKYIIGSLPSVLANFEGELTLKNQKNAGKTAQINNTEHSITEAYQHFTYSSAVQSRGKYIGYMERLIVIILTIVGAYEAIAFIIAAKSIARFKQLDDRNWAEYFLLGTLSSIFLALAIGLLMKGFL